MNFERTEEEKKRKKRVGRERESGAGGRRIRDGVFFSLLNWRARNVYHSSIFFSPPRERERERERERKLRRREKFFGGGINAVLWVCACEYIIIVPERKYMTRYNLPLFKTLCNIFVFSKTRGIMRAA